MAKDVKFNIKLQVDGKDVVVQASTNVKQLANDLGLVHDRVTAADKAFMKWTQSVVAIGAVTNSIQQISGVLNTLTEDSRTFGAAMKAANTMAGKDAEGFEQLKDQVAELSKSIPMARDELANGLYQVISNGVPEDNWIDYLRASSRAAVGGIADVGEVVKVTSTVIKNYGLEWSAAQDIQDKIQLTAKNGVTSFEQLAAALPSVTGQAAQLGVSFTEMLAVMSTLTGVTGNTSEVATQLASVLTALTKESSKSQKMAEEMGISFNAASIQAAGGLRNYLQELDRTVTAYAQKSGQLKESIYSKLFGRAEALRLVNGLTGEMAAKFDENIAALDNSAGTIDKAFETMSSTGAATTQMLKNQFAAVTDLIAGIVGGIQPYLNFTAQLGMTILSVTSLTKAIKGLNIAHALMIARTKAGGVAMLAFGLRASRAAAFSRVFSAALKGVAFQATAAKIAIRGLMMATGVGVLIAGVTFAVEKLTGAFEDASDAAEDTTEKIDRVADTAQQAQDAFANKQSEVYSSLMTKYTQLQTAWKALSTAHAKAQWIKDNKKAFEELGLKITNAKDAEDTFVGNTDAVVESFKARAKAAARLAQLTEEYRIQMDLADEIARGDEQYRQENTVQAGEKVRREGEFYPAGHSAEKGMEYVNSGGHWVYTDKGAAQHNANIGKNPNMQSSRDALAASQERSRKIEGDIAADAKAATAKVKPTPTRTTNTANTKGDPNNDKIIEGAKSYADLTHNIGVYKKQLEAADPANKQLITSLRQQIADAEEAAQAAKDLANGWDLQNPDTLEEIDEAISRQQALRKKANAENLQGIDAEIKRLQGLKAQMERNAKVPTPIEQIHTYEQLDEALAIYNDRLKVATEEERAQIQTQIIELERLRKKWDATLEAMKKPGPIGTLKTIEDLDNAISYYGQLQKHQSADEIAATQQVIQALEAKKKAMQRPIELAGMQKEIDEINAISGREFKVKIKGMGFDALTDKIRELKKALNDIDNPPTENQRKQIEGMIATYEEWRRKSISAFDTARNGWDGIKGIGNSIQSITDALEGNGNAWQKTVALVDAFIGLYEGIQAVIGIINLLSAASSAHAVTKGVEAGAETTEAATREAATAANVAASVAQIAANKLETASWAELAAAMTFAAHAYIPFAGTAIAAGMIATQQAMILAAGIPKYEKGALAFGPTLGIFGEYAGASHNPEVVAPLDKLRSMIEPSEGGISGDVRFVIDGDKLVGILKRKNNQSKRS
jgi:TP901 family phage tail tape measure protein